MRPTPFFAFVLRPLRSLAPLAIAAALAGCTGASAEDPPSEVAAADSATAATCLVPVEHPMSGEGLLWIVTPTEVMDGSTFYWRGFPSGVPQRGPSFTVTSDQETHFGRVVIARTTIIAGQQVVTVDIPDFGRATIRFAEPGSGGVTSTAIDRVYACTVGR